MAGIFWAVLIVSLIESGLLVMRIPYFWAYTVFEEAGFRHHGRVPLAYLLLFPHGPERSLRTERHMVNNQFIGLCGGVHFQFQHDSVPRILGIVPRMVQDALQ
ncbi:MAG: hypothetical protein NT005_03110 [Spirochaetes bacterium]|nr:hypothetical protein [Spirochaetota bacterium]